MQTNLYSGLEHTSTTSAFNLFEKLAVRVSYNSDLLVSRKLQTQRCSQPSAYYVRNCKATTICELMIKLFKCNNSTKNCATHFLKNS